MASKQLFETVPPFPDNIPVADLPIISLAKLSISDVDEGKLVFEACRTLGFFILDLTEDVIGKEMTKEIDHMFQVSKDAFNLPYETKMKYRHQIPKSLLGYKARGEFKTDAGRPDRHEQFSVGYDDIVGNEPAYSNVPPLEKERETLRSLFQHSRVVLSYILHALEKELKLPHGCLEKLHTAKSLSNTGLRTFRYGASLTEDDVRTSLVAHTDWGSVSLVANLAGGLQVLKPGHEIADEEGWEWVKPRPGCLVVNLGDAMVEWTGGVLRSNMHRVNYSPGEQRYADRQSLVVFFRPQREAQMQRLAGGLIPTLEDDARDGIIYAGAVPGTVQITADEWERNKAMDLAAGRMLANSRGGRELVAH